ncbi:MAG: HNH endonuclease, partial [Oceanospirillales bacterium]|nr:HNH endonuclease [Oceanospirillales bacterium]
ETVYCGSIIGFELLLIHTLRIFCTQQGWPDLEPRIKAGNLMACFDRVLQKDEAVITAFIELLWQVRYQFDTWVVKWVEHDDRDVRQLCLTNISRSLSGKYYYINRTAKELSESVQLQAVRNFTGDRSAHYWLTALLGQLVKQPDMTEPQVLAMLERLDNDLSLTTETQKEASFKLATGQRPDVSNWLNQEQYFTHPRGTSFEHYWFQKLEYLLWKQGAKTDEKLGRYRITSKNSVEHVHPQNEEYKNQLHRESLDAFGNLVLLSPGENSSYSNQTVLKKMADFESKHRYDSLKLKAIYDLHLEAGRKWTEVEISEHQARMLEVLKAHYTESSIA